MTEERIPTQEELTNQLQAALTKGDFAEVAKVSGAIVKLQKGKEAAELTAKQALLAETTKKVLGTIQKALAPMVAKGELDQADGVWYSWTFGDQAESCKLLKTTVRERTGGGGGGKKFDVSTTDMLAKHSSTKFGDTGMTFQDAYDAATANADKGQRSNAVYKVREALLKAEGLI